MSIYQARPKPSGKPPEESSGGGDLLQLEGALPEQPPAQNLAHLRKARPAEFMLPATVKWFEALPPEVRPVTLAAQYARIANLLAQQWTDDKACRAYFDELLTGRRGKRRGFPVHVRRELWGLREHYLKVTTGGRLTIV